MSKIIIQVPVERELLDELDKLSKEQSKSRSEVIRQACRKFLDETEEERLDRIYVEGYKRIPETTEWGEAQEAMLSEVWPKESW
ncbi:MAG: ribbon-helix-helix domain-containing protein [Dehalococcoidales bacterium]|nr:ribbon-helix-helix domain-containing protein [Dehalococcoidales bacterium]